MYCHTTFSLLHVTFYNSLIPRANPILEVSNTNMISFCSKWGYSAVCMHFIACVNNVQKVGWKSRKQFSRSAINQTMFLSSALSIRRKNEVSNMWGFSGHYIHPPVTTPLGIENTEGKFPDHRFSAGITVLPIYHKVWNLTRKVKISYLNEL